MQTYKPSSATVKTNVKKRAKVDNGILTGDALTAVVEDAVSDNLLQCCNEHVSNGLFNVHAQLRSLDATLYSQGGIAIHNYIRGMGLHMDRAAWKALLGSAASPKTSAKAFKRLYEGNPRDWDLCVLQATPPRCRSLSASMKSPLFQIIFGHVHAMRREIHNRLASAL